MKSAGLTKFFRPAAALALAGLITGCSLPAHQITFHPPVPPRAPEDTLPPAPGEERTPPRTIELPETGGVIDLSVEQALVLALRNNRDLLVQQLNPVIAGTFEQIERGKYYPEVFAEYMVKPSLSSVELIIRILEDSLADKVLMTRESLIAASVSS